MPDIQLVVQGDDFGMCHAVNTGVVRAFTDGIVTQASTMTACPWFAEAAQLALEHGIPTGLHQTLTCEWDYLRWGPITAGASLRGSDGTFRRTVADAKKALDIDDAINELTAQAARATEAGMRLDYLDVHMGMVAPTAYQAVAERLGVPFLYPGLSASMAFDSIAMLSAREAEAKKGWMLAYLTRLGPGRHLLVSHPAEGGTEISAITSPGSDPWRWAEEYRVSDLAVLTDPDVRAAVEDRRIILRNVHMLT